MSPQQAEFAFTERDFSVKRLERKGKPFNMPASHYHVDYEIYYLAEGSRSYFIKDRTYEIKKGDLLFIGSNEIHRTTTCGSPDHTKYMVQFKEAYLADIASHISDIDLYGCFAKGFHVIRLDEQEQAYIENLFNRMADEYIHRPSGSESCLKLMLAELLIFINRRAVESRASFEHPNTVHAKISDIAKYINENYMHDLSLAHLVDSYFISPNYLSRMFKKVTGFTVSEYVNNVRVREAGRLLIETEMGIADIAGTTGFNSITHFGRVFKAITGCPPLQYRKKR